MKNSKFLIILLVLAILIGAIFFSLINSESEKIKIGVILPLTGPAASVTEDMQKTLLMYEERSKNIELVFQDDQCSGKGALSAYNIMKNQGIKVYMAACSGSILALAPALKEDGNLLVTGFGGSIAIRETGNEVIRFIPDGLSIADRIIEMIKSEPNKKYAIFAEQQDYPKSMIDRFQAELGDRIITVETYKGDDATFKTQIIKLMQTSADAIIFIPVSEGTAGIIYKEMQELGFKKEILGEVNVCDHAIPPSGFGLKGQCLKTVLETEGYTKYLSDYKNKYNSEPLYPFYNAITYDVLITLDELLSGKREVNSDIVSEIKAEILDGVEGQITNYKFTPEGEVVSGGDYLKVVSF